ncbi:hypothetical protein N656DRAFT_779027 [Canariomyces notabilis]|uniref:Uncharacterized protein n=1 Tax=Canariomyces notabilis TaxID=2074819 RepID=A0AAN6TE75_9PEZI|nr:hypothetical protein N656DRAFT_779027 [Canariomyces arenarius]
MSYSGGYLSVNNDASGSVSRSRSRSPGGRRSRSGTPSSTRRDEDVRPPLPGGMLPNVRVFEQSRSDPEDMPQLSKLSRTFRFVVFVMHFAISMLESPDGREALIDTAGALCDGWTMRGRRNHLFRADVRQQRNLLIEQVDAFLDSIRENPPNMVVSSRLVGEGVVQRQDWAHGRGFNAKWAAMFRLNGRIIDDAIEAAEDGLLEEFQRFLLLMGIATVHELIHVFVAQFVGNGRDLTPPQVNFPGRGTASGESGRFYERQLIGFVVQSYYDRNHPLGERQPGDLVAYDGNQRYEVDRDWMRDMLNLNFRFHMDRRLSSWTRSTHRQMDRAMQDVRGPGIGDDFRSSDLTGILERMNNKPVDHIEGEELHGIMKMARDPRYIKARGQS